jgi:membrane protein implicated in regulation of membrane protease activity
MAWWSWGILGVALLGVELLAVDAQFYLVFAGLAAVVVGLLGLVGLELPIAGQWLLFGVLAVAAMFTLRRPIYAKLMNRPFGNVSTDLDQRVTLTQDLAPGKSCRIEYRGSGWTALNIGDQVIPSGSVARIDSIDGVTLRVRAI